jgi:2-polyprenyl-3-methyl-5-hydroxy-6-metoxy-1,4-benzoquinol methylase
LYGKQYWISPKVEGFELPDIFTRSRADLIERCLYWLTHVLRYKKPPGRSLEVGCAHGAFVMLMEMAGFDAVGSEMSPWVVDYASNTFNVRILCRPIDDLPFEPLSYDCILLFDVVEHLPRPDVSLQIISALLKPDGVLAIQTPHRSEQHLTFEEMRERRHSFVEMMKDPGHLFLFTEAGLRQLLSSVGFHHIAHEPPLFPYDMFVFAGKESLEKSSQDAVDQQLLKTRHGRVLVALLDLYRKSQQAERELAARLEAVQALERQVEALKAAL